MARARTYRRVTGYRLYVLEDAAAAIRGEPGAWTLDSNWGVNELAQAEERRAKIRGGKLTRIATVEEVTRDTLPAMV